jgi:hypothetical protein
MFETDNHIPTIGEIVHYYPDKHTRQAAQVLEIYLPKSIFEIDLQSCKPVLEADLLVTDRKGKQTVKERVKCVDTEDSVENPCNPPPSGYVGRWTIHDAIQIEVKDTDDDYEIKLSQSNFIFENQSIG